MLKSESEPRLALPDNLGAHLDEDVARTAATPPAPTASS